MDWHLFYSSCRDDDKHSRRDRFHSGAASEFKDKDNYKPNVKLEYIDDSGRLLNEKEAFRYLSHKFHGKGPGKNKIEKRLKKNEQETVSIGKNLSFTLIHLKLMKIRLSSSII